MTLTPNSASEAYRERVYGSYVSEFKGKPSAGDLSAQYERHARFLDQLLRTTLPDPLNDVLEIGCGPGAFLYWARRKSIPSTHGIDIAPEQVAIARELGLPASVASFQEYLPAHREAFDLIVAFDVIEHLSRDEGLEMLDRAYDALRPGGRIILATPNGAALRSGPIWRGDLTHETLYSPATIQHALRLAGFAQSRVSEIAPPALTLRSAVRRVIWHVLRLGPMLIDIVETGGATTRVYSRNMLVSASRPNG